MWQWLLENGEKLGIVTVLGGVGASYVVAMAKEWLVPGKTHTRALADKDNVIKDLNKVIAERDVMIDRLLGHLERTAGVAELNASVAEKLARRKTGS